MIKLVLALVAIASVAAFSPSAAGGPCAPSLCFTGEDCPQVRCQGRPDQLYDLGDIPFAIQWPEAPSITREVSVSTRSELEQAAGISGSSITLRPGEYGNVQIAGSDLELVLEAGVEIGFLTLRGQRISLVGNPHRQHRIRAIHAHNADNSDLFFLGLNVVSGTTAEEYQEANNIRGTRIAWLHSYIDMVGHAMFMGHGGSSHIIVANTWVRQHRGRQAGPRLHDASYLVFVDSRFENMERQSWRLHTVQGGGAVNVVLSRNQFVGSGIQLRPNSGAGEPAGGYGLMTDIWLEDNVWYHDRNVVLKTHDPGEPVAQNVRFRNNQLNSALGFSFPSAPHSSWEVSGNTIGGYQEPPEWTF
jgi:hypothetical protein